MSHTQYNNILRNVLLFQRNIDRNQNEPTKLVTGLYLGNQRNAECYTTLKRLNITHVLNCAGYKGPRNYQGSPYEGLNIVHMEFMAEDTENYDITQHFSQAFSFIDKARRLRGVVLVHCALGVNRSGATCLGYLMLKCQMHLLEAAVLMKSKRNVLLTNTGFQKQLVRLAKDFDLLDDLTEDYLQAYLDPLDRIKLNMNCRNNKNQALTTTPSGRVVFPTVSFKSKDSNIFKKDIFNGPSYHSVFYSYLLSEEK